jgi:predicted nucleotidyltransferase
MLPAYYDGMYLPPGDHVATWDDVVERFCVNEKRQSFCRRLRAFLVRAKHCGFVKVYLFGSFISAKDDPGDVDLLWVHRRNLDYDTLRGECRELVDYSGMKEREKWDMFCCSDDEVTIDYFMCAWHTDKSPAKKQRGVIVIQLGTI